MEANSEAYSETYQTSKLEVFAQIGDGFYFLTIFAKSSISDVRQDFDSKARYDFTEKAPSQMFNRVLSFPLIISKNIQSLVVFAKLLAVS